MAAKQVRQDDPRGSAVWICGDCHVGNIGPLADLKGKVEIQISRFGSDRRRKSRTRSDPACAFACNRGPGLGSLRSNTGRNAGADYGRLSRGSYAVCDHRFPGKFCRSPRRGSQAVTPSAAALDVYAIAMLASTIRQIVALRQIDYSRPVTVIQKQLEMLHVLRIRSTQRALLGGTVGWAPF